MTFLFSIQLPPYKVFLSKKSEIGYNYTEISFKNLMKTIGKPNLFKNRLFSAQHSGHLFKK